MLMTGFCLTSHRSRQFGSDDLPSHLGILYFFLFLFLLFLFLSFWKGSCFNGGTATTKAFNLSVSPFSKRASRWLRGTFRSRDSYETSETGTHEGKEGVGRCQIHRRVFEGNPTRHSAAGSTTQVSSYMASAGVGRGRCVGVVVGWVGVGWGGGYQCPWREPLPCPQGWPRPAGSSGGGHGAECRSPG